MRIGFISNIREENKNIFQCAINTFLKDFIAKLNYALPKPIKSWNR